MEACFKQVPVIAGAVTRVVADGAHNHIELPRANFVTGDVVLQRKNTKKEAQETDNGSKEKRVRVKTKPCEIKRNLDAKIILDVVERLITMQFV